MAGVEVRADRAVRCLIPIQTPAVYPEACYWACMKPPQISWTWVLGIAAAIVAVFVLVATFVGLTEALAVSGTVAAASVITARREKRQNVLTEGDDALVQLEQAAVLAEAAEGDLEAAKVDAEAEIHALDDAEKVSRGYDLLGD